ncbi:cytochrome c oxidase subunit 3 [Flavobacterium filum]|uniref:cytochrome c oxidase subunit 3 n=1 Tax=Flavobacterium filum TaxID=370974 RepID=UPI000406D051|nr:cytochrome c oxidase subunit 3 [Flavobacterium filum]
MTVQEYNERKAQSYKLLLWFAMISMVMMFAGLTSAYVVSTSRKDWLKEFDMPIAFVWSTILIIISSVTIHLALSFIKKNDKAKTGLLLWVTLLLGIGFVFTQFLGFGQIIENGYFFTGSESNVTTSFLYIIVIMHLAHLFGGLIALLIVIYNHYKQKYNSTQTLGIELAAMFWHFLDFLWILLFLFFYFYE